MDALEARFGQVEPRVIIACNGYAHGGKTYDSRIKVNNLLKVILASSISSSTKNHPSSTSSSTLRFQR